MLGFLLLNASNSFICILFTLPHNILRACPMLEEFQAFECSSMVTVWRRWRCWDTRWWQPCQYCQREPAHPSFHCLLYPRGLGPKWYSPDSLLIVPLHNLSIRTLLIALNTASLSTRNLINFPIEKVERWFVWHHLQCPQPLLPIQSFSHWCWTYLITEEPCWAQGRHT